MKTIKPLLFGALAGIMTLVILFAMLWLDVNAKRKAQLRDRRINRLGLEWLRAQKAFERALARQEKAREKFVNATTKND